MPEELAVATLAVDKKCPLCVDLDGTLVRTDTLLELLLAVRPEWRSMTALVRAWGVGRAAFKAKAAAMAKLEPSLLPYDEPLLDYLRAEKAKGRYLVLATGSDIAVARSVAEHLGVFDEVIASDGARNLKGEAKARALTARFGETGFCYAGNDASDLEVWKTARAAVIVNASRTVADQASQMVPVEARFDRRGSVVTALAAALRPHQWLKNLLVFVPVITGARQYAHAAPWLSAAIAFVAFSAVASAVYVVNDLSDLPADRAHPRKRFRPFASGALQVPFGLAAAALLFAAGGALGATRGLLPILAAYAALSIAYSMRVKEFALLDIFVLATLYMMRLFAGGLATGYLVSLWLLGFSGFFFLALATMKRVGELIALQHSGQRVARGRGYTIDDCHILQMFGCSASFVSALVLALFVQSETASILYANATLLWGVVPLILFWQCRLWLATARGQMHDDPLIYAVGDRASWITGAALGLLFVAARWL
jgi:4-hydroxybenzoate polyprenyltransferase/phosphoserine phosphatase